jgi:NAD-dependent deacetylase
VLSPERCQNGDMTDADVIATAKAMIEEAQRIVALTGAGISTDSGIPDFRGPKGVWTRDPKAEKLAHISHYLSDPEVRRSAWMSRLDSRAWSAEPNDGHRALVRLERRRKLHTVITQNVDGLHQAAGTDPDKVVEIHGTIRDVVCMTCEYQAPMQVALDRVRAGEADPDCPDCGGILKSATISFGQNLVAHDLLRADLAAQNCDLMLAIGSTLGVWPAAGVVPTAKRHGARVIIVNADPTEMDDLADAVIRGSISEVLPALAG